MNNQNKEPSTFERIMKDPDRKKSFDDKYATFLLSEFLIEEMEQNNLSVRALAKESGLSTSIIQGIRSGERKNMTLRNVQKLTRTLGYNLILKKGEKQIPIA